MSITCMCSGQSLYHIFIYLSDYLLLKLTCAIVISTASNELVGTFTWKGIITFGYMSGEDNENRHGALSILITVVMQLFPYISASSTQGHSTFQ